ncbi:hypothetical protein Tco_1485608 [Tanacetum coccineum]
MYTMSDTDVAGYVADSDPEEDSEEDHADYSADGGDDDDEPSDDDDDDIGDEDEEPFEDEEDDEEEEHLAPADSSAVPITDPVPSAEDTEALETDEAAPTPVPSPRRHTARMSVRPQTPVPLPSEAEVERLLALPIPPPSPLTLLSTPLTSVDPTEAVEEVAQTTLEGVNDRVTELAAVQEQDTQDIYAVIEDTQGRQTQIYQRVDILAEDRQFHYETARLTHTQMQDYRIASQESLTATLIAHVSALQGQLSATLGQIQALQTRDQTHAGDREGAGSSA